MWGLDGEVMLLSDLTVLPTLLYYEITLLDFSLYKEEYNIYRLDIFEMLYF